MTDKENPQRCEWCLSHPLYIRYHDEEWGIPVHDDKRLFEMLTLEGAQAGLNWLTILKKRNAYRQSFDDFDFYKIALYDNAKYLALLGNEKIVRNKLKIAATITNAQAFLRIREEYGSVDTYLWEFVKGKAIVNNYKSLTEIPSNTELSDKVSKDLRTRNFKFVGTTIIYAFMQAIGMVDDHIADCWRRKTL